MKMILKTILFLMILIPLPALPGVGPAPAPVYSIEKLYNPNELFRFNKNGKVYPEVDLIVGSAIGIESEDQRNIQGWYYSGSIFDLDYG